MNWKYIIEKELSEKSGFCLRQTFGHPFKDFKISGVGATFEGLIGNNFNSFLPEFNLLYQRYISENYSQFDWNAVSEEDVRGRVARMWASLVREWHAFYSVQEYFVGKGLSPNTVIRNDFFDTSKGIDIYIKNENNPDKSIKVDILMDSLNSIRYRETKDLYRQKGGDVPGRLYRLYLGGKFPENTKKIPDRDGIEWFLLSDKAVENIFISSFETNEF